MTDTEKGSVRISVVGVGGAGCNAVHRMVQVGLNGLDCLAVNTDVQVLSGLKSVNTFAIGPDTTGGFGSGGNPDVGRRAMRESRDQVAQILKGSDMVFVTAGMGGGTGTGAAPLIADIAKKQGSLTVGVVTQPFSFEGSSRREIADHGLQQLRKKVDSLIVVENDRLLSAHDESLTLDKAFHLADDVLRQGIQGISEILTSTGLVNVDFADVRSVMTGGESAFMAIGEGKGRSAATDAVCAALNNPLFQLPLDGARGILVNVRGGKDISLRQVQDISDVIQRGSRTPVDIVLGVVRDTGRRKRVSVTLVATGIKDKMDMKDEQSRNESSYGSMVDIGTILPVPHFANFDYKVSSWTRRLLGMFGWGTV